MSITFTHPTVDIPRDRWGRPLITPQDGVHMRRQERGGVADGGNMADRTMRGGSHKFGGIDAADKCQLTQLGMPFAAL